MYRFITFAEPALSFSSVKAQADHSLLVEAVVDWNLSNDLLLFIDRNTYEQYGGYNLFQNTEFKANFSIKVWRKC